MLLLHVLLMAALVAYAACVVTSEQVDAAVADPMPVFHDLVTALYGTRTPAVTQEQEDSVCEKYMNIFKKDSAADKRQLMQHVLEMIESNSE